MTEFRSSCSNNKQLADIRLTHSFRRPNVPSTIQAISQSVSEDAPTAATGLGPGAPPLFLDYFLSPACSRSQRFLPSRQSEAAAEE